MNEELAQGMITDGRGFAKFLTEAAVKAERERCAKVWSDRDDRWLPDVLEFLDPSEDGA